MEQQQFNYREKYLEKGFIVFKSFYNKNKIRELRSKLIQIANTEKEILNHEIVQELILQDDLISKIKSLLQSDKLIYYSDSNIVNKKNALKTKNGFHNDARFEDENIPYEEEYPILRFALYFEDYKKFSGGLKIKEKSHKHFCFNFRAIKQNLIKLSKVLFTKTRYKLNSLKLGKSLNMELEEGDIIIWNLRTHHCGVSRRLKLFPKWCLQPFFEKLLPLNLFLPTQYENDRCSIFCTFAKNDLTNSNILNYVKNKMNKTKINEIKNNKILSEKLKKLDLILPDIK